MIKVVAVMGLLMVATQVSGQATEQKAEEAAVRAAVSLYLQSHATGDGQHVSKAFHPELKLMFVRDGQLMQRTAAEYISGFRGQPAADEAQRKRWIELVDVTGSAAIAKVVLDYPTAKFADYFTLLKINGEWKIMNKTFHSEPKAKQ